MTIDGNNKHCKITIIRKTTKFTETFTGSFSIEEAKQAGLLGKDNWKNYPARMLKHRALSFAARDSFPDVFAGIYTPDEISKPYFPDYEVIEDEKPKLPKKSSHKTVIDLTKVLEENNDSAPTTATESKGKVKTSEIKNEDNNQSSKKSKIDELRTEVAKLFDKTIKLKKVHQSEIEIIGGYLNSDKEKELNLAKKLLNSRLTGNTKSDSNALYSLQAKVIKVLDQYIKYDPTHRENSVKKHLGTDSVRKCNDENQLNEYLEHLRIEYQIILQKRRK